MQTAGPGDLPPPWLLFGTLSLLFRFPLWRGPVGPATPSPYFWTWNLLFAAGAAVSLFPAADAWQRMLLGSCMLFSYARTWFRWGGEVSLWLWTLRVLGLIPVLWPLLPR